MKPLKLIKTSDVRNRIDAAQRGEITYKQAVELLNKDANKRLKKKIAKFLHLAG